ncbi:hypothetical protein JTE90_020311 [Oedothorax gibbosus]|uniref:R3H domain-containing protein n=1 Tax=Oedothorax gibbosus TaxID=931172 RepID=A0AAV6VPE6_9ARAC|nr:hypothetical protein JTE90_020311 [Oedothorax gibbosus]
MGVIKKSNIGNNTTDSIEDVLDDIESVGSEPEPEPIRPRRLRTRTTSRHPAIDDIRITAKSGKRKKRVDNSNFLLSLAEEDETQELTIIDFIPPTVSVFSQLFLHRDNIEIWHEFLNCTKNNEDWFQKNIKVESDESEHTGQESYDGRADHPAFTASKCFQKIDGDLRFMLKKKHVPLGTLTYLEQELVTFFGNRPQSIYHCQFPNSYDRLMIHALSQYMDLSSLSYNRSGARWTRVKNKLPDFFTPPILLSSFLEKRYNNKVS